MEKAFAQPTSLLFSPFETVDGSETLSEEGNTSGM